jgi:8-oxo-dGTP pyrophosphatase MutT (NUDIX family)
MRSNPSYWGRAAAGILFTCEDQILLALRSESVSKPNLWGVPGGSVSGERYFDSEHSNVFNLDPETIWKGAQKEVIEELGSMPGDYRVTDSLLFKDGSFTYTTFIVAITLEVRKLWKLRLNWENSEARWFPLKELPTNLHPGLYSVLFDS